MNMENERVCPKHRVPMTNPDPNRSGPDCPECAKDLVLAGCVDTCPRCGDFTYGMPSLSRKDGKTEICSGCSFDEIRLWGTSHRTQRSLLDTWDEPDWSDISRLPPVAQVSAFATGARSTEIGTKREVAIARIRSQLQAARAAGYEKGREWALACADIQDFRDLVTFDPTGHSDIPAFLHQRSAGNIDLYPWLSVNFVDPALFGVGFISAVKDVWREIRHEAEA